LDALFPQPHAAQVQALTEQQHLPPDFVYAIMRRESGYDPTVVSSADAIGLLQLIEPTAKQLANALGISPWKRALLFQPEINLRLGSRYLADLLALYHGQAVPAIAAYNAGEHRVSSWLTRARKRNKLIEVDRFVEDIPIEQTRNYVRAVVANWARYRYMADPAKPWPIELPLTLTK
jgi:soluble lytic murein transglycosylase